MNIIEKKINKKFRMFSGWAACGDVREYFLYFKLYEVCRGILPQAYQDQSWSPGFTRSKR